MGKNQPGPQLGKKLLSLPFLFYFLCSHFNKVSLQTQSYIKLMKFSPLPLRARSILSSAIMFQRPHCVHWAWRFSNTRDTPTGIKSFLCGRRTHRVTGWWDSFPLYGAKNPKEKRRDVFRKLGKKRSNKKAAALFSSRSHNWRLPVVMSLWVEACNQDKLSCGSLLWSVGQLVNSVNERGHHGATSFPISPNIMCNSA